MRLLDTLIQKTPPEVRYALVLYGVTRLFLTVIGVSSRILLQTHHHLSQSRFLWLDIWGVWDTGWYLAIAKNGYPQAVDIIGQTSYGFFPLYPLLMRTIGSITINPYIGGLVVSNVSLILSSILLYRLVRIDHDHQTGLRAIKFLYLSPVGFILSGAFTESLFLLLVLLCFYFGLQGRWLLFGISGFFLALTKGMGVLIVCPLFFEYWKQRNFQWRRLGRGLAFFLLVPMALVIFSAYLDQRTGDWSAWLRAGAVGWNHRFTDPISNIRKGLFLSHDIVFVFPSIAVVLEFALLTVFAKRIRFSYWLFGLLIMFIATSFSPDSCFSSLLRHLLPIFPMYILLGILSKRGDVDTALTVGLALLQGFLMVFWSNSFTLVI